MKKMDGKIFVGVDFNIENAKRKKSRTTKKSEKKELNENEM